MRPELDSHPDAALARLADRQYGVVARWQLASIGVTLSMLRTRIARGRLVRLHRGVYAVGHRQLRPEGYALAAVLATGRGAVLSHRDAAWLHGLRPGNHRQIDVLSTARATSTASIRAHHSEALTSEDMTTVERIPVTTVARTLVDLADVVPRSQLAKTVDEAERQRVFDLRAVERALDRTARRRGSGHAVLRAVLDEHAERGLQLSRSVLEDRFAALIDAHGLLRPRQNAVVEGVEVDALWAARRLVVELDGWAFHSTRRAAERDRAKTNALQLAGYTVLRFTHHQLAEAPAAVVGQLRAALG